MMSEKRTSDRVIPMVTDEEMVVVNWSGRPILSKLMDLSETGALLYILLDSEVEPDAGASCSLSLYHNGRVFQIPSVVSRKLGRLIAFQFEPGEKPQDLHAKLIRMEVEWNRLKLLV